MSFLFFTGVCVALHPGFVLKRDEGGMSNYGLHIKTAVPYTLALGVLVVLSRVAATHYSGDDATSRGLRLVLRSYSVILLAVLVTSYVYSLNPFLKDLHFAVSATLVVVVGVASLWLYGRWPRTGGGRLLLATQVAADVLALITLSGHLHLLFATEILSNVSFAGLLLRAGHFFAREEETLEATGGTVA